MGRDGLECPLSTGLLENLCGDHAGVPTLEEHQGEVRPPGVRSDRGVFSPPEEVRQVLFNLLRDQTGGGQVRLHETFAVAPLRVPVASSRLPFHPTIRTDTGLPNEYQIRPPVSRYDTFKERRRHRTSSTGLSSQVIQFNDPLTLRSELGTHETKNTNVSLYTDSKPSTGRLT